jgi:AcrR family transcriptional regulator
MVNTPVGILSRYSRRWTMTMTVTTTATTTGDEPTLTPAARRILDAATDLFYSRGINSVGVELIAEQAGTTKKTIYDRFGSKEGLVVAYLEARARRWQAHVTGHLAGVDRGASDRAVAVLDALASWLEMADRGCGFVAAYAELSTSSERATGVVRAEKQWTRELFHGLLAEGGVEDDGSLARQLALVLEGAIVESTAGGSAYALDDARTAMRTLVGDR